MITNGEDVEKLESLYTIGGNLNGASPVWETVQRFLKKLKVELWYDPTIPLLDISLTKWNQDTE